MVVFGAGVQQKQPAPALPGHQPHQGGQAPRRLSAGARQGPHPHRSEFDCSEVQNSAFYINADPDPGSQTKSDPCRSGSGQTFTSMKVEFLQKNILNLGTMP